MIQDLSRADFDWLISKARRMKTCHEKEFLQEINPDLIRAFYRGRKVKDARFSRTGYGMSDDEHLLMLSLIFSSANTILPNLIYQYPQAIVTAIRGQASMTPMEDSAALLSSLLKFYSKKNDKKTSSQESVMNSYWFGLGWSKVGYSKPSEPSEKISEEPETKSNKPFNFQDLINPEQSFKPDSLQFGEKMEFIDEGGLVNSSESPLNVMLDETADLLNSRAILHTLPRTLYELMNFQSYDKDTLDELYTKFKHVKGSRMDTRDVELRLNELHIKQRNGIWIMTYVEGFDKPLQYEKSTLQTNRFQFIPLCFTNEPGVRYPISHMKIAVQVQDKIDKMASLFYENVSRARNLLFINEKDLSKGTLNAIESNKIGGIALTNKPINTGTFAHAQSPSVQNDLPTLIAMCQQSMIETMGSDSQMVSGKSKNKTLGQDELARVGTKVRESGMQDRLKDFLIRNSENEAELLKQYSDAQLNLEITGEDYSDAIKANDFKKQQIEFMTSQNPMAAKRFIEGVDYDFDFNMEDAVRPDSSRIMEDIERTIAFGTNPVVESALNNDGVILKVSLLAKEWLSQVKTLGNPKKYLQPIDSMQLAAIQTKRMLMNGGGMISQPKIPSRQQPSSQQQSTLTNETEHEPSSSMAANL